MGTEMFTWRGRVDRITCMTTVQSCRFHFVSPWSKNYAILRCGKPVFPAISERYPSILRRHRPRAPRQRLTIAPRHPLRRTRLHFHGMPERLRQVIERVGHVQFAGVEQNHEEIAHPRPFVVL
jgi:hypothetical protein